jgi:hypothetical protein
MKSNKLDIRFSVLALIIIVAAMTRLLPHPPNMTAVGAMAIFGGAHFSKRWQSIVLPVLAYWLSDVILNNFFAVNKVYFPTFTLFSKDFYFVAFSLVLMTMLSWVLVKVIKVENVVTTSIIGSLLFFLITNFGSWINWPFYPMTPAGLGMCYVAGLPFLGYSLVGDLLWCGILFGGFELAKQRYPQLAIVNTTAGPSLKTFATFMTKFFIGLLR